MVSGEELEEEEEINRSFRNLGLEEDIDLDESFCLLELDGKDLCFVGFVYCVVARQQPGLGNAYLFSIDYISKINNLKKPNRFV